MKRIKTQRTFQTKIFATKGNVMLLLCRPKSALPELHISKTAHMSKEPTVLPSRALFEQDKNQQGVVVVCIEDGKTMGRVMHQSLFMPSAVTNLFLAPTYYAFRKAQFPKFFEIHCCLNKCGMQFQR